MVSALTDKVRIFFEKYGLVVAFALIVVTAAIGFYTQRQGFCQSEQRQYDGQVLYTRYLAGQLNATADQEQEAVEVLVATIGDRPEC